MYNAVPVARRPHLLCRSTGKERDAETGLYYYGARYLDGKTSRWLSADPALGDYVPGAPVDDEARKRNGNLPGMGGVFNTVNFHLYHYAGNNPVKYVDPNGKIIKAVGDDGVTYTWDNEKNEFYSGTDKERKYNSSDSFVADVKSSLLYLKEGSTDAETVINAVSSSRNTALIKRGGSSSFSSSSFIYRAIKITFGTRTSLNVNDETDSVQSPALGGLYHELAHTYSHLIENKLSSRIKDTSVGRDNKNAEEVNAMRMADIVAGQLGEPLRGGPYSRATNGYISSAIAFRNNQR